MKITRFDHITTPFELQSCLFIVAKIVDMALMRQPFKVQNVLDSLRLISSLQKHSDLPMLLETDVIATIAYQTNMSAMADMNALI